MSRRTGFLLIVVAVALAGCTRQIEVTPTPTATPIPSHEEMAKQLTQRVTNNLRRLSQLNTLCDNVLNGGINAYYEATRDTFAGLVALPESRLFDLNELQIIFTQGIEQASDFLPPSAQPGQTVAPKLTGQTVDGHEVILAMWGNAPCNITGHVHAGTNLYVFDAAGQVLYKGGADLATAYPAVKGWLVTSGDGYATYELWHLHPVNNHWEKEILFQQGRITGVSVNERAIQVDYEGPSFKPPCRFRSEIADTFDHALLSGGQRDWIWRDDHYALNQDHFQNATVFIGLAGGTVLKDWQQYCMD